MSEDVEKRVTENRIDIEVLKNTSQDTLRGVNKICDMADKDREQNRKSFDGIDKLLRGKDSDNPGLMTKVDRLENYSKRIKAAIGLLGTAMIAMIATVLSWILGLFGKGN